MVDFIFFFVVEGINFLVEFYEFRIGYSVINFVRSVIFFIVILLRDIYFVFILWCFVLLRVFVQILEYLGCRNCFYVFVKFLFLLRFIFEECYFESDNVFSIIVGVEVLDFVFIVCGLYGFES